MEAVESLQVVAPQKRGVWGWIALPFVWLWRILTYPFRADKIPRWLKIVTFPVWGVPWAIWKISDMGWDSFYNEFLSYVPLTWRRDPKTKEALWMRMVSLPDEFYYHYLVWWCLVVGGIQSYTDKMYPALGVATIFVYFLVWHIRVKDLNLKRLGAYVLLIVAVLFIDQGVKFMAVKGYIPSVFTVGLIRLIRDGIRELGIFASPGAYYAAAIWFGYKVVKSCIPAVLDSRWELDERDLHFKKLTGEATSGSIPRYMRPVKRRVPDILEWLSGCADMEVELGGGKKVVLKNVFGLAWWGKRPFIDLSYATSRKVRAAEGDTDGAAGRQAHTEDAAELVGVFKSAKEAGLEVVDAEIEEDADRGHHLAQAEHEEEGPEMVTEP